MKSLFHLLFPFLPLWFDVTDFSPQTNSSGGKHASINIFLLVIFLTSCETHKLSHTKNNRTERKQLFVSFQTDSQCCHFNLDSSTSLNHIRFFFLGSFGQQMSSMMTCEEQGVGDIPPAHPPSLITEAALITLFFFFVYCE